MSQAKQRHRRASWTNATSLPRTILALCLALAACEAVPLAPDLGDRPSPGARDAAIADSAALDTRRDQGQQVAEDATPIRPDADASPPAPDSGGPGGCATAGPGIQICEDFNAYPTDSPWTEAQVRAAFHVSKSGIGVADCSIVADPLGDPARGNVVGCLQREGDGAQGFQFQGQIGSHEEAYFAFDLYLPPSYQDTVGVKIAGLMGGKMGWASGGKVTIDGFSARHMYFSRVNLSGDGFEGYGNRAPRGLQNYCYWYDSRLSPPERVQKGVWYDTELPWSNNDTANTYHVPLGEWITIEQRVKMNSIVDGVPQEDGVLQNWINGQLMVDQQNRVWRSVESLKVDALFMMQYYGGPADDADWQAPQDQISYYDNFIVSTEPITH